MREMPTLHLCGIPHTQTTTEFSHCAFTGKVKRFSPMMRSLKYDVIHYGIEGADSGATEDVNLMGVDEWNEIRHRLLFEKYGRVVSPSDFVGDLANMGNELYTKFNARLRKELSTRLRDGDIICLPFGPAHASAVSDFPHAKVETGIGYPNAYENFRIYESYAWYHYIAGKQNTSGNDYWWVIPNYFDISEWDFNPTPVPNRIVYLGRIAEIKGIPIIWEIAKHRPDLEVIICGQGDPSPYLTLPNLKYQPPLHGRDRSTFLGSAQVMVSPTRYVEPFGGTTIEAQLTGTPVIGSTYGSFTETIREGFSGFRAHTLGDYLQGIDRILGGELDRQAIRKDAVLGYDMYGLAHNYHRVFMQVGQLRGEGWYSKQTVWL